MNRPVIKVNSWDFFVSHLLSAITNLQQQYLCCAMQDIHLEHFNTECCRTPLSSYSSIKNNFIKALDQIQVISNLAFRVLQFEALTFGKRTEWTFLNCFYCPLKGKKWVLLKDSGKSNLLMGPAATLLLCKLLHQYSNKQSNKQKTVEVMLSSQHPSSQYWCFEALSL